MKKEEGKEKLLTLPNQRRDSKKNLIKVAKIVLKKPNATEREIAKEANV